MASRLSPIVVYLLALLFIGIGYLAILPVFEGFDESAHFSSLREIADTDKNPVYGLSNMDKAIGDYQGPRAYDSLDPPYDRGMTYSKFFAQPDLVARYLQIYRQATPRPPFTPGDGLNWEAQHPPLYYALLAPLEKATDRLPFVSQIFWLRLASYLLALAGVALGLLAVRQCGGGVESNSGVIGFALYPVILPMFFPEFTRIGNDSLCLLFAGFLAFLLPQWVRDKENRETAVLIGVTLGAGLLTKAFFIPITAAVALFGLVPLLSKTQNRRSHEALRLLWMLLPALLIGGVWYAYQYTTQGDLIGSDDAIRLAHRGGLLTNLKENGTVFGVLRGITVTAVSYSWGGTWSLTRPSPLLHLPLLLLAAWVIGAFVIEVKRRPLTDSAWLPVWLFGVFGCGLFYHVVESVAINGNGNTPGWYLHILMPWAAPAIGVGVCSIWQRARVRVPLVVLLLYAVLFQLVVLWSQFTLFTGCAVKGDDKYFKFSAPAFCLDQAQVMLDRLAVLGWPVLAFVGFCGGLSCALLLFIQMRKPQQRLAVV